MNIIQIEYFLKLAELCSFRKAAEALYVSQPAVSKQISLLEKEWGFALFDRSYRSVKLTTSGEIMLNIIKKNTEEFEDAMFLAKKKSRQYAEELRIGLPEYANIGNISDILMSFQNEHPEINLKVKYAPMAQLELNYPDGEFDMVINYERNMRGKSSLETRVLGKRRHMAIVSKNHPALQSEDPRFENLKGERVYVPGTKGSSVTTDYCIFICNNHGFTPIDVEVLPNIESVLMAVKMGFGFCVLDDLLELPERFNLLQLPTRVCFDVVLAWNRANTNPMIRLLADKINDELELQNT